MFDAQTYHAQHAFPPHARCVCGRPPVGRAIVMAPYDEAAKRLNLPPMFMAGPAVLERIVYLKGGDGRPAAHVNLSTVYCCEGCQSPFEKALAKTPSWAVVDLSYGPNPRRAISVAV